MSVPVHVTIKKELLDWVNLKVKELKYSSFSHAVNVALMELKRKETVKL